jgi:Polyketide cyclase / dehydrase and lipid transport
MMNTDSLRFPAEYDPSRCPVHVVNTIEISASPAEVWDHLITAADWQTWQPALSNVRIQDGSRKLSQDVTFTFNASGVTSVSTVKEFVPNQRIAWDGRATGLQAYHVWLITPTPNGCRVLSEETLRGIVPRLLKLFAPNLIYNSNQKWLEALAVRSSTTTNSVR